MVHLQESMRLFPVVGSGTTRRNLERDMWVGGGKLFVPRGVLLWIPMHAVQNVAANWDQPDQFQPERWTQVTPPPLPQQMLDCHRMQHCFQAKLELGSARLAEPMPHVLWLLWDCYFDFVWAADALTSLNFSEVKPT